MPLFFILAVTSMVLISGIPTEASFVTDNVKEDTGCRQAPPSVKIEPAFQSGQSGEELIYILHFTSNDVGESCPVIKVEITSLLSVSAMKQWKEQIGNNHVFLFPGQSVQLIYSLESTEDTHAGLYPFVILAKDPRFDTPSTSLGIYQVL